MPTYRLRRTLRPDAMPPDATSDDARTEDGTFEARDDAEAIGIAQAEADRADGALAWVELTDGTGRRVWGLRRGETLSRRPDGV